MDRLALCDVAADAHDLHGRRALTRPALGSRACARHGIGQALRTLRAAATALAAPIPETAAPSNQPASSSAMSDEAKASLPSGSHVWAARASSAPTVDAAHVPCE